MDARAGEDVIHNTGTIDVDADAVTSSNSVAFTVAGVAGAVSTSTATADAVAISGGDGDDRLINEGTLDSNADATAVSVSFAASAGGVAIAADAVWDGGTKADAHASGLDGGRGDDTIQNTAEVDATANSTSQFEQCGHDGGGGFRCGFHRHVHRRGGCYRRLARVTMWF